MRLLKVRVKLPVSCVIGVWVYMYLKGLSAFRQLEVIATVNIVPEKFYFSVKIDYASNNAKSYREISVPLVHPG